MQHMVQVNGSQYVLSSVQPTSASYPVMLIPVAAKGHNDSSNNNSNCGLTHGHPHHATAVHNGNGTMSDEERKARHIKTPQQMRLLKNAYVMNPKPGKEEMKSLMKETKCSYNEVCRWFRNERHKEKKIKDGRVAMDVKPVSTPPATAASASSLINGSSGIMAESKPAITPVDNRPQSPSSGSLPSTPASSQPSSPQSSAGSASDGDRRLAAWLRVFTSEFTSEQQQAALRELISRTRTLAESGKELESVLNGKRGRVIADGMKSESVETEEDEDEEPVNAKRRKVDTGA